MNFLLLRLVSDFLIQASHESLLSCTLIYLTSGMTSYNGMFLQLFSPSFYDKSPTFRLSKSCKSYAATGKQSSVKMEFYTLVVLLMIMYCKAAAALFYWSTRN